LVGCVKKKKRLSAVKYFWKVKEERTGIPINPKCDAGERQRRKGADLFTAR